MPESEVSMTVDCPEPSMYLRLVVASKMTGASLMPVIVIVSSAFALSVSSEMVYVKMSVANSPEPRESAAS